jgi:hypothetical protein
MRLETEEDEGGISSRCAALSLRPILSSFLPLFLSPTCSSPIRSISLTLVPSQVLQATILLSYIAYTVCLFTDLWLLSGIATRLLPPLGLNHMDPWNFDNARSGPPPVDWGVRIRFVERREVMPTVKDLAEHWRRATTFWLAFSVDRWASASTDWSTSIDEKDISTHLPCAATMPVRLSPVLLQCQQY